MFVLDENVRYYMPVTFGPPENLGDLAGSDDVLNVEVPFLTDRDRLGRLLPPGLEVGPEPIVSITYAAPRGVHRLAGRGFNIVGVRFAATHRGEEELTSRFAALLWEGDTNSIIAGRENFGIAKLYADIPDLETSADTWSFSCAEYGSRLLQAEITGMTELGADELDDLRSRSREGFDFGWKYIPSMTGGADVSLITTCDATFDVKQAWRGQGTVEFFEQTFQSAPASYVVVNALRELPVLEWLPVLAARGPSVIDRRKSRTFPAVGSVS